MSETDAQPTQEAPVEDTAAPEPTQSDWRETLPQEFRDAPYFKGEGKTPEQVRADLENAASWQGNSIRIPGPDAPEDARKEFINKAVERIPGLMPKPDYDNQDEVLISLGRPDEPSGYKLPEGLSKDDAAQLAQRAHSANLTQKQFDILVGKEMESSQAAQDARTARQEQTRTELKTDWGDALDDRVADVKAMLAAEGAPEGMREALEAGDLDAQTIKFLYSVVEMGAEKAEVAEQEQGRTGALTPDEAMEQAQEIWQRLYEMGPSDPRYDALKKKRSALIAMAVPD